MVTYRKSNHASLCVLLCSHVGCSKHGVTNLESKMKNAFFTSFLAICLCSCASVPKAPPKSLSQFHEENKELKRKGAEAIDYKLRLSAPIFPRKAAVSKQQGWCVVTFTITSRGDTVDHKVIECSPIGYFESAALDSAKGIEVTHPPAEDVVGLNYTFRWNIAK